MQFIVSNLVPRSLGDIFLLVIIFEIIFFSFTIEIPSFKKFV
jgi:hypothetical protein